MNKHLKSLIALSTLLVACAKTESFAFIEQDQPTKNESYRHAPSVEAVDKAAASGSFYSSATSATLQSECHVYDEKGHGFVFHQKTETRHDESSGMLSCDVGFDAKYGDKEKAYSSQFWYSLNDKEAFLSTGGETAHYESLAIPENLGFLAHFGQLTYLYANHLPQFSSSEGGRSISFSAGYHDQDILFGFRDESPSSLDDVVYRFAANDGVYRLTEIAAFHRVTLSKVHVASLSKATFGYERVSVNKPTDRSASASIDACFGVGTFFGAALFDLSEVMPSELALTKGCLAPLGSIKASYSALAMNSFLDGAFFGGQGKNEPSYSVLTGYLATL